MRVDALFETSILLRVILVDPSRSAGIALAEWLRGDPSFHVKGPAESVSAAIILSNIFRPHVVLLNFDGVIVPSGFAVRVFKELSPAPAMVVLTHSRSDALRSRLREAGADAVFDRTAEIELLLEHLKVLRRELDGSRETRVRVAADQPVCTGFAQCGQTIERSANAS